MSDEAVHYMESTSRLREQLQAALEVGDRAADQRDRLRAENEKLRRIVAENRPVFDCAHSGARYASPCDDCPVQRAEATMREVAEELHLYADRWSALAPTPRHQMRAWADRLDPPPKEHRDE